MRKIISLFAALILCITSAVSTGLAEEKKISVVTAIFPIYDWAREVIGENENAELTLLLDSGVDLHSYQPTAADIMKIASCDVFIYVGGESDKWVEDALKEAVNPNLTVVSLLEVLGSDVKPEEIVEGMKHEHEDHDHEEDGHGEDHDHDHEEEAYEHVWLSLRNAQKLVSAMAEALGRADPAHAESYLANAAKYNEQLAALDAEYEKAVSASAHHTVLFGDRFPFRYLVDDYGLDYFAAFSGCSAETEASFQTIIFLAQKVDELQLPAVLTIEGVNHKIAETVVGATASKNQAVLTMNSMQGCTLQDIQAGVTYLSIMEENLEVLRQALN